MERPKYKSKRCVNCQRGEWPGKGVMGEPWYDTVKCPLLSNGKGGSGGLAFVNYVCKEHVWRTTDAH